LRFAEEAGDGLAKGAPARLPARRIMQKLLLELGGPLVVAFVLLAIAKFIRGLLERFRNPDAAREEIRLETAEDSDDEAHSNSSE
jgi:hypothetical protein